MGVRLTARDFSLCNHYADKKSGVMNLTIWYTYGLTGLLTAMVVIQVTSDKRYFYTNGQKVRHLLLINFLDNLFGD